MSIKIPSDGNWKPTIELKTGSGEISETVLDWRKYTRQIRISDMEITAPTQDYLLLHMFAKLFLIMKTLECWRDSLHLETTLS